MVVATVPFCRWQHPHRVGLSGCTDRCQMEVRKIARSQVVVGRAEKAGCSLTKEPEQLGADGPHL
jgi:hypothetical protein